MGCKTASFTNETGEETFNISQERFDGIKQQILDADAVHDSGKFFAVVRELVKNERLSQGHAILVCKRARDILAAL